MTDDQRVLLLDADSDARARLRALLDGAAVDVTESAYDTDVIAQAEAARPSVVFAAVDEPVDERLGLIEQLQATVSGVRVVAYTPLNDLRVMRRILQSGIDDLLPLPLDAADVQQALRGSPRPAAGPGPGPLDGPRPRRRGEVLTVFGAKGGIGKTTIATSLATAIASHTDLSVLIVDMDTRFGDIAIMLNVEPQATMTDLVARTADGVADDDFVRGLVRHESGAYVLAAPKHPSEWSLIDAEQVQAMVVRATQFFDYVVLDTPGAFTDMVAASIEVADTVLMISSLEVASIKDTVHMLDLLDAEGLPPERLRLVLNQVSTATTIKPEDIEEVLHREVFWHVPYDPHVVYSNSAGRPIVLERPKSRAAKQLHGLALKLIPEVAAAPTAKPRGLGWGLPAVFAPWRLLRRSAA